MPRVMPASPEPQMVNNGLFRLRFNTRPEKTRSPNAPQVALLDTMIFEDLRDWAKGRRLPGSGARLWEVLRCTAGLTIAPGHAMEESVWARNLAITEIDLYQAHAILAVLCSATANTAERWLREGPPGAVRAVLRQIPSSAELEPYAGLITEGQQAWFLRSAIPFVLLRRVQQRTNKGDRPERRVKLFGEFQQDCIEYGGGLDPWSSTVALVRLFKGKRNNDETFSRLLKGMTESRGQAQLRADALNVARDVSMLRRLLDIEAGIGGYDVPRSAVLLTRDRGLVGLHEWVGADVKLDGEHSGLRMDRVVDGLGVAPETNSALRSLLQDLERGQRVRVADSDSTEQMSVEAVSEQLDVAVRMVTEVT